VVPLGEPSLLKAVDPPNERRRVPPEEVALKAVAVIPLPQVRAPLEMAQLPLEVDIVKLLVVPEKLTVASVCVDHVPAVRSPPVVEPLTRAFTAPLVGRLPEAPVVVGVTVVIVVVGVEVEVAVLGRYLMPLEGQEPDLGASMRTKFPSMADPCK
jgi:hypothetical protein